jgi:hypothetical protein
MRPGILFAAPVLAMLCAWTAQRAAAMTFDAQPPLLYLRGRVVNSDWLVWEDAMSRFHIDTVIFGNSPGGDAWTARRIGRYIRGKRMTTVVAGRCISACANMFLGGVERQFSSTLNDRPTVLGFHGIYRRNTGERVDVPVDYFLSLTDGKMSSEVAKTFTRLENRKGALYFIHRAQRSGEAQALAYLCEGEEEATQSCEQCENKPELDAVRVGVLTTWELRDLPASSFVLTRRQRERGATVKSWE